MFFERLTQRLNELRSRHGEWVFHKVLSPVYSRFRSCMLSTAGLVIKTAGSPIVKTGAAVTHYVAKGRKGRIAAATDMPALVGTVTNANFNVFVFSVDSDGNTYSQMGLEAASEGSIIWPNLNAERATIGFVIINPTGTGDFVGGTTALDNATVVPNAAYVSPVGMWDTTARID